LIIANLPRSKSVTPSLTYGDKLLRNGPLRSELKLCVGSRTRHGRVLAERWELGLGDTNERWELGLGDTNTHATRTRARTGTHEASRQA
jgi:hypothetical protein